MIEYSSFHKLSSSLNISSDLVKNYIKYKIYIERRIDPHLIILFLDDKYQDDFKSQGEISLCVLNWFFSSF